MTRASRANLSPVVQALLAAVLFGASAPFAKLLLSKVEPIPLAGFLYLGSGLSLGFWEGYERLRLRASDQEARLAGPDVPWLLGAILAGGIAAPILLLFALRTTPAATAALLLNFEAAATTLVAAFAFGEAISRRAWWAIALITLACVLLSLNLGAAWGVSIGASGIAAACLLWGIDNNLTRTIATKNPRIIATIKGLAAGCFSLVLALALKSSFPPMYAAASAMLLGTVSYGLSIMLFVRAMRALGAARASALFGTAPFAGMLLSLVIFRDIPSPTFLLAVPFMVVGAALLLNERHEHYHVHEMIVHEHAHDHIDGHHNHADAAEAGKQHTHLHQHESTTHAHHHMPDAHHRHAHRGES